MQVLKLSYPYQAVLQNWGGRSQAAQQSIISMSAPLFYKLHPFHLVMDADMVILQWGEAIGRVVPDLKVGLHVRDVFRVSGGWVVSTCCKHCGATLWGASVG